MEGVWWEAGRGKGRKGALGAGWQERRGAANAIGNQIPQTGIRVGIKQVQTDARSNMKVSLAKPQVERHDGYRTD